MDSEFIPKEFEKILISLGFYYTQRVHLIHREKKYYGILWQQAFDFFREKYNMSGEVYIFKGFWNFDIEDFKNDIQLFTTNEIVYSTHEEARLECLKKLIEIVKNK